MVFKKNIIALKAMLKLSNTAFIFLNAILLTLLNFNLFLFIAKNLNDLFLTFMLVFCYFFAVYIILSLIFIKYLTKIFSILFIISAIFCVYFMSSYGILIDSDMILNVMQTDTREASELFNSTLVFLSVVSIVWCIFVIKLEITKDSLSRRILTSFFSLVLLLVIFLPFTRTYIPFFRNYNIVRMYNTPFYQFYAIYRYYQRFIAPPRS